MNSNLMNHNVSPIFILASGQRCGSTLLQRFLNSHKDILIWGEQHGFLNGFLKEYKMLLDWENEYRSHREIFLKEGYDNFVANMMPTDREIQKAVLCFIQVLFGESAKTLRKARWGFKEVRYDASIGIFLQRLFPKSNIIHLTRDVIDCFLSLKHWENAPGPWTRRWTEIFLKDWQRINSSFLLVGDKLQRYISIQYEDIINKKEETIKKLCFLLNISLEEFDIAVFHRKLHREGPQGVILRPLISRRSLTKSERDLLTRPPIPDISKALGYNMDFERD